MKSSLSLGTLAVVASLVGHVGFLMAVEPVNLAKNDQTGKVPSLTQILSTHEAKQAEYGYYQAKKPTEKKFDRIPARTQTDDGELFRLPIEENAPPPEPNRKLRLYTACVSPQGAIYSGPGGAYEDCLDTPTRNIYSTTPSRQTQVGRAIILQIGE